jgi:lysophospholipase L1-like esterase
VSQFPRSSSAHSVFGKAILAFVSVLLTLGVAEIALRVLEQKKPDPALVRSKLDPQLEGLPTVHGVFGLMTPNTRGIFKGVLYRTNGDGFRGREYTKKRPAGMFRTVLIGDSFTMGSGVAENETYAMRLESLLDKEYKARDHEVLNLGIGGFNLHDSVVRLRKIGLKYDPNLIIYGWTANDIEGPSYRRTKDDWSEVPPPVFRLWRMLRDRWTTVREAFYPVPGSYMHELNENYFDNPDAWSDFLTDLGRFARVSRTRGVCGVVFLHTILNELSWRHPFSRHYAAVAAAAEERELFVVPSFPDYRGRRESELWVHPSDPHPNARGHRILADALLRGLQALPPRCGITAGG